MYVCVRVRMCVCVCVFQMFLLLFLSCPSKVDLERSFGRVGELSLKEPSGTVVKLKRVVEHPDNKDLNNDITLVQLQEAVPFSDTVEPVVLPSHSHVFS